MPVAQNYKSVFEKIGFRIQVSGGPVYRKYFDSEDLLELPCDVSPDDGVFVRKAKNFINLFSLLRMCKSGDKIIFQASASATLFLGLALAFGLKTDNFLIQYSPSEARSSWFKRMLWRMSSSRIRGIIGPSLDVGRSFGKPICVVPDYICTEEPVDFTPAKKVDFSLVGTITPKKGVVEAASYLVRAGYSVLVAGRADREEVDQLKAVARDFDNLRLELGYLTNQLFAESVYCGIYSVLNYTDAYSEQSSGIVFDSLFRLRPVLGRRCKALQFVEDERLGVLYDDIREVDIPALLDVNLVCRFKDNIRGYLGKHHLHAERLRKFILD